MNKEQEINRIRQEMRTNYGLNQRSRKNSWHPLNPVSLHYRQVQERELVRIIDSQDIPIDRIDILDAGCGGGGLLRLLAALGADPARLWGVDLVEERIHYARQLCPQEVHLEVGELSVMSFPDSSFDLISQFTVFSSILDPEIRQQSAAHIRRMLRPGGWLLWYDMHSAKTQAVRGLPSKEVDHLFTGFRLRLRKELHPNRIAWLAARSLFLAYTAECIPFLPRTHWLSLYQKPVPG